MRKLKSTRWAVRLAAVIASALVGALGFAAAAAATDVVWDAIHR